MVKLAAMAVVAVAVIGNPIHSLLRQLMVLPIQAVVAVVLMQAPRRSLSLGEMVVQE
jgi:hypothetical protein